MVENTINTQAFKLKGRLYTLTVIQILNPDKKEFNLFLKDTIERAPKLFDRSPIVIDLSSVNQMEFDLGALLTIIKDHGLIPVAIQHGSALHETVAQCNGLAVLNASTTHDKTILDNIPEAPAKIIETTIIESIKTKLLTTPVRSGQRVVSKGGDLIITSSVSHGAELLADGNIHVYGTLRGRALAGMSGDTEVRIFCQSLEAELVSIAGIYRLSDAIEPYNGPCQIYLVNEQIIIEPL